MFRDNTVFIVGAGASAEFELPVGSGLAKRIQSRCACIRDGNGRLESVADPFLNSIIVKNFEGDDLIKSLSVLDAFNASLDTAVSIDAFIDRFRENDRVATLGKVLIALEIAEAERESILSPQRMAKEKFDDTAKRANDTWIGSFTQILLDGVYDPETIGKNITIICFNYDRCIEQHLVETIAKSYTIDIVKAEAVVSMMNIIHPYGTLGSLPWNGHQRLEDVVPFGLGADASVNWMQIANENIRTYTQQRHDVETVQAIHNAMGACKVLVFLGFGFNNQNLDLLRLKGLSDLGAIRIPMVYSSGLGISRQVGVTLQRRIGNLFSDYNRVSPQWQDRIHIEHELTCSQLFDTHYMNLNKFVEHYVDPSNGELIQVSASGNE